ncbi:GcrA cell cycle regulator [Limibaculum sp. FT325]|uniref:GcrA family cell cycle regulator n=1 Tax=Thermohalobaculum sediminis TaxID=2939436 RepID=UPI0020C130F0|nr:GcrA family cell cycle regulator [Limibaculum sediminis]MCL5778227.1 GcrA cell cycle regulator [Limibaculum sediminis]
MSWTDERVEKLKELWADGMSASQIAKQLGGVTRNAVIGKVHRLGLSNRVAGGAQTAAEDPPARPAAAAARPAGDGVSGRAAAAAAADPADAPAPAAAAAPAGRPSPEAAAEAASPEQSRREPAIRDATLPRPPGPPTPEEEEARETLAEIEKMARRLDLLDLTERTCKWPIGDPTDDDFHFCGLPSVSGKPYCEHHVLVAFQPMSTRRDRGRAMR